MPLMKMRCLLPIVCLGALAVGCASNKPDMDTVQEMITGTWCDPDEDGKTCVGYMVYYPDGAYHAYGAFEEHDVAYESRGDWRITGDRLCLHPRERSFVRVSTGIPVYPEMDLKPYCHGVEDLDDRTVVLSDPEGEETRNVRVSNEPDETLEPGAPVPPKRRR